MGFSLFCDHEVGKLALMFGSKPDKDGKMVCSKCGKNVHISKLKAPPDYGTSTTRCNHEWEYYKAHHDLYHGQPATKRRCKKCGEKDNDYRT
jgi:DNA-directed RNA polymerase subunit M/transcription elongation factor TFIIS